MKKRRIIVNGYAYVAQMLAVGGALVCGWLMLNVPDSTLGHLVLSLILLYATAFLLGFGLAASVATLIDGGENAGWRGILAYGRRGWWRAAAVAVVAGVLCYIVLRAAPWLPLWVPAAMWCVALLVIPAAIRRPAWHLRSPLHAVLYLAAGLLLVYAGWLTLSTAAEMSRAWLEMGWLAFRTLAAFLLANAGVLFLLAAGVKAVGAQSPLAAAAPAA